MSQTLATRIEALLGGVEKPARYIGGEVGSVVKDEYSCRVALSYPDVYEIGTANQAVQIIYSLINESTSAWAQRVYCPWPDMSARMRENDIPLFLLESWEPVRDVDIWGITLQYELTYTNILEMLDLAGIPLNREERTEADPLVFGGGPCASNPHPVARFFDFIIIGDGELVVPEILRVYGELDSRPRQEILKRLAEVEGIFVPAFPRKVKRAIAPEMNAEYIPLKPVIPSMHAIHDRATLEIKRGCTHGCRFCLAGTWYRPVRERPVDIIPKAVAELIDNTGYEEVSLSSLSTTDYSDIRTVLRDLVQSQPGLTISLPSLRVDPAAIRLLDVISAKKGSITLAPEAGTQRLRDVINKQITNDDIYEAIEAAFASGSTTVKLYFMIGLPKETEADLQGIIDIATTARRIGRQVAGSKGRVQINVSVSTFVPKAHTPFQWYGLEKLQKIDSKQDFLRRNMPRKQIKLSLHDAGPSLVEGAIARGRDETALAIENAWRAGAGFDAWTEKFDIGAWEQGFSAISSTIEQEATRTYGIDAELPWDDIDSRVSKEFLLEEREKAERMEATPDCRWSDCTLCGVCDEGIEMRIMKQ